MTMRAFCLSTSGWSIRIKIHTGSSALPTSATEQFRGLGLRV